jgi:transcriptional regulator with XRE-family HTH domain
MNSLGRSLRSHRVEIGLTQSALARKARVSLATVQNVEAGRANPAMATVKRILDQVGMTIAWKPRATDWDALATLGLPLRPTRPGKGRRPARSARSLRGLLMPALAEVRSSRDADDRERKTEALQALLLAIRDHYPSVYRRRLAGLPLVRRFVPVEPTGRVVRLSRMARAMLGEYL